MSADSPTPGRLAERAADQGQSAALREKSNEVDFAAIRGLVKAMQS